MCNAMKPINLRNLPRASDSASSVPADNWSRRATSTYPCCVGAFGAVISSPNPCRCAGRLGVGGLPTRCCAYWMKSGKSDEVAACAQRNSDAGLHGRAYGPFKRCRTPHFDSSVGVDANEQAPIACHDAGLVAFGYHRNRPNLVLQAVHDRERGLGGCECRHWRPGPENVRRRRTAPEEREQEEDEAHLSSSRSESSAVIANGRQ